MRRKKGFSLTELIIVMAIFAVLIAVVAPAWATYTRRVKFRTQNKKAKAIFNAAQVVLTDLEFAERKYRAVYNDSDASDENNKKMEQYIYTPLTEDDWYYYWDGNVGYRCDWQGDAIEVNDTDSNFNITNEWNERIGREIERIVTDDMAYKIWVNDYKVKCVVCASNENSRFIGAHPTTIFQLPDDVVDDKDLMHTDVRHIEPIRFDLDTSDDGSARD